jgi:hypothetical protein
LLLLVSALAATASAKHIQQVRTRPRPIAPQGQSKAAGKPALARLHLVATVRLAPVTHDHHMTRASNVLAQPPLPLPSLLRNCRRQ